MVDKKILESLNYEDKEQLLEGLGDLIEHSYKLESEFKELKSAIDSLPNALWIIDKNGVSIAQNSEAKKISKLIDFVVKESKEIEFEEKIYLIKTTYIGEKQIISATDITEQKRAERLASMGKIAAHLSHEIRNPIGAISLLAGTLMNRVESKNKPIVQEIKNSIYRVERIIKSTLLFTKGTQINRKPFALLKLKDTIEDAYEYYSMSKDIVLDVYFDDIEFNADFDLLEIVMQNFLYNGIDAIEEDDNEAGTISFFYKKEDGFHTITVKDSGKEIEDENILYEPFKTTKLKGSGLGLALSLEIIKAHDGKIELLSGEKGFKIWLK